MTVVGDPVAGLAEAARVSAGAGKRPLDVLIVASWFPSADDGTAGRFVADQAEALLARGDVVPRVASFDAARLTGGATARDVQAAAVLANGGPAITAAQPLFVRGAVGVDPRLPVARLPIPEGLTRSAGAANQASHRGTALAVLADRLMADRSVPDVIHAHTGYPDGAAAVRFADRVGCSLVITEHASFVERILNAPDLAAEYRAAIARASRVLAVSEMLAGELRSSFPEYAERIVVMPNAVAIDGFVPAPLSARRPDELLFVGYRKASKGIETLLQAFALVHAARPTASLRLIGGAADEAVERQWQSVAATLGIGGAVQFEPAATRTDVSEAMARASVFVHASPRETFGMVAAEALASGLPVVATDSGGVTEVLGSEPDSLGAIVPRDSPEALAAAILATLDRRTSFDPARLRASVEHRFGASQVAERLVGVYREAIQSSRDTPDGATRTVSPGGRVAVGRTGEITTRADRAIVVALDPERARTRLASWPAAIRDRVLLITATGPGSDAGASSDGDRVTGGSHGLVGGVVHVTVDAADGRARTTTRTGLAARLDRLVHDPLGTIARRLGRGPGTRSAVDPATRAVSDAIGSDPRRVVVAVDGSDHLALQPLVAAGRVVPHLGLRRLADEWLGDGRLDESPQRAEDGDERRAADRAISGR